MKKILCLLLAVSMLSSTVLAQTMNVVSTSSGTVFLGATHLTLSLVNQDPIIADPGAYLDLTFKIENNGTDNAQNTTLELIPEYPFSLDPGASAVSNLGTINGLQGGSNAYLAKFKVRVDSNAVNGDNEIKARISSGDGTSYVVGKFNISVSNPRTDFDVITQDSTTLAVANIGSNSASSVIVSIPPQKNFRVNGATSSIIGSLNAGDYTLVTFQFVSAFNDTGRNLTRGGIPGAIEVPSASGLSGNVTVDISYTDLLGIRRIVEKSVPFVSSSNSTGTFTRGTGQAFSMNSGLTYIIIGVVGIVVIVAFIKLRTRKKK
jgi:uncharacterized membrane protein YuzA (DUF378 family)